MINKIYLKLHIIRYVQILKFQSCFTAQIGKTNQQYTKNNKKPMIMLLHFLKERIALCLTAH